MNSKYYTPTIEEFHVEFEFEVQGLKDNEVIWQSISAKNISALTLVDRMTTRVKYLDKEDIEECGWKFVEKSDILKFKQKEPYDYKGTEHEVFWNLWFYDDNRVIIHNGLLYDSEVTLFTGRIKNKSELKRLMKQLGIYEQHNK